MENTFYPYLRKDILVNKMSYSYSQYLGVDFIKNWRILRTQCIYPEKQKDLLQITDIVSAFYMDKLNNSSTELLFNNWILSFVDDIPNFEDVNLLLKRFEVTKNIYGNYDKDFRPLDKSDFENLLLYIKFGCVLVLSYNNTGRLQYLNSLLKLCDILCSLHTQINHEEKKLMSWVIENEIAIINKLMEINNIK